MPPSLEELEQRIEEGVRPSFGDPFERQEREALRREIVELRSLLAENALQHGGIGHNQPPAHLTLDVEMRIEVARAIGDIDAELAIEAPAVAAVAASAGRLRHVLEWAGRKLDKAADSFVTALGTAGGLAFTAHLAGIHVLEKIGQVYVATLNWLNTVTLPF